MVTVQFFKYPNRLHWRHEMHRLGEDQHGVWLGARSGTVVQRGTESPMTLDSPFVQLIPPASYWSLIYNGEDNKYPIYVDISTPASWVNEDRVEMIDIDLDVVRRTDGSVEVLDEDEFLDHQVSLHYPGWLVDRARTAAAEIVLKLEGRQEPFDENPRHWLARI